MEEKAKAVLPSGLLEQLEDPKWKERLEACTKFKEVSLCMGIELKMKGEHVCF